MRFCSNAADALQQVQVPGFVLIEASPETHTRRADISSFSPMHAAEKFRYHQACDYYDCCNCHLRFGSTMVYYRSAIEILHEVHLPPQRSIERSKGLP